MPSEAKTPRSIFAKPPIKVIVGSEDRVYYVHHGALEAHPTFEAQLKSLTDDYDHPIDWCAFDEQTIECVLSFLYTGTYQPPEVTNEEAEDTEADEETPAEDEEVVEDVDGEDEEVPDSSVSSPSPALSDCDLSERPLTPLARCCGVDLPEYLSAKTSDTKNQQEKEILVFEESPTSDVYVHTKVYAFAHQVEFVGLKQFSLNYLAKTLVSLEQTETDLFPYLSDGIRLIYTTTEAEDDARYLLSQFVAMKFATLAGEEFDKLVAEGGEVMVDVSRKLARKITSMTNSFQEKYDDLVKRNEELEAGSADKGKDVGSVKEELRKWEDRGDSSGKKYPVFTYEI